MVGCRAAGSAARNVQGYESSQGNLGYGLSRRLSQPPDMPYKFKSCSFAQPGSPSESVSRSANG